MISLLLTTTSLGLTDSLNPFGVSMQFVLQGSVKKSWHICFYIIATGVTNLLGGLLAYFGLFNFLKEILVYLMANYQGLVITIGIVLALVFFAYAFYQIIEPRLKAQIEEASGYQFKEEEAKIKVKSVSPKALVVIGAGAAISELSTAFPYFAFLAFLFSQSLPTVGVLAILLYYNILYCAPLIVLYFVYKLAHRQFDRLYKIIQSIIERFSNILAPLVSFVLGIVLIYLSLNQLL